MTGSGIYSNGPSTKYEKFTELLGNYYLLQDSALWSQSVRDADIIMNGESERIK